MMIIIITKRRGLVVKMKRFPGGVNEGIIALIRDLFLLSGKPIFKKIISLIIFIHFKNYTLTLYCLLGLL